MTIPSDESQFDAQLPERVRVEAHDLVDSTNALARGRAEAGAGEWTVIQAMEQSAGRGRRASDWRSPRGNLYTSTILRPSAPMSRWPQLSFVAALAVVEMARVLAPSALITVKWPNDVLANGLKLSGILLETTGAGQGAAVVVGVGINIASHPTQTRYGATSIGALSRPCPPLDVARAHYLNALTRGYDIWSAQGFSPIRDAWTEVAHGLGSDVLISDGDTPDRRGRLIGIDEEGRLMIETPDGGATVISAGSLSFVDTGEA